MKYLGSFRTSKHRTTFFIFALSLQLCKLLRTRFPKASIKSSKVKMVIVKVECKFVSDVSSQTFVSLLGKFHLKM